MRLHRPAALAALLLGPAGRLGAQGRVTVEVMPAGVLGVPKALAVYLPESYDTSSTRFRVAYYLHGAGGNERVWTERIALDSLADSLHQAGLGDVILVMPDGDAGYWTDWAEPDGYWASCLRDPQRIRPEEPTATYCVRHGRYETYLVSEVVPFVDSAYRTLRDRRHRGIGGFSMEGTEPWLWLPGTQTCLSLRSAIQASCLRSMSARTPIQDGLALGVPFQRYWISGRRLVGRFSSSSLVAIQPGGGPAIHSDCSRGCW